MEEQGKKTDRDFGSGRFAEVALIDVEVGVKDKKVHDFGACQEPNRELHGASAAEFARFIDGAGYLCGHNVVHHDLKYLEGIVPGIQDKRAIDTLYLSPLLFSKRPYHRLLKDDKLQSDELNNPLNDARKARDLFHDEVNAFLALPDELKAIFCTLLRPFEEFGWFFDFVGMVSDGRNVEEMVGKAFAGRICAHADIAGLAKNLPRELAYALALVNTGDSCSVTPPWVLHVFPNVEHVLKVLCGTPCREGCAFCNEKLDIHKGLRSIFGYGEFRLFDGEPMQERAVQAAVSGESLLAIFPTGGGKSLTFQLPALMQGRAVHGLTVVISPLQSLMKDQVDNLAARGITEAVTINGLLDPLSRAEAIGRVADGAATMLYISPEMLRSKTIEKLLLSRNVVRFVIDEAHCFSAWGQDFRVDYLYIGDFIRKLREKKGGGSSIPVSCFTATAKQKVISDIRDYFRTKLGEDLRLFASSASRENLQYSVIHVDTEEEKYQYLRSLLLGGGCPAIVYVSRTRKTRELADKLTRDGIPALPFNGKMEPGEKIANQNAFILNEVRVIVATSAFGMGVDKKDVGLVVHYDISDSLENYVQEAGRAGRDPHTAAKCHVLYSDQDLDKHFILLNQTKLSISEIQQGWSAIKTLTRQRRQVACSALEIARQAGWNDEVPDIETRVRTAVAALEEAGYVSRGNNVPHVFATGIMVKNMDEARRRITESPLFDDEGRQNAIRIIKSLISSKHVAKGQEEEDADSRVDYLADILGMTKEAVIGAVTRMRQEGILADSRDMSAFIERTEASTSRTLERFAALERF
jgi:ATP-dependent DNA helicase RecQ